MPINVAEIKDAMRANLGVRGSQRYVDDLHYVPSIRDASRTFKAFVNSLLAENKGSEELLAELSRVRVFQTNIDGGVVLTPAQLGHSVWTVLAVYPEPVLGSSNPNVVSVNPVPLPALAEQSLFRSDLRLIRPGNKPCKRITLEQVPHSERSRFMPGSERLVGTPQMTYAYYIVRREVGRFTTGSWELIILPASVTGRTLVGISYLEEDAPIQTINDTLPYPGTAFKLITELALNSISIRQGLKPMYEVTVESVRALLKSQA